MELVVVFGCPGFAVKPDAAQAQVHGDACGQDMTRRNLQLAARDKRRPRDLGKDVQPTSVCSEVVLMPDVELESGLLTVRVNGPMRHSSNFSKLICNPRELIGDLSLVHHLQPGDLICTGTPEAAGPVRPGDRIDGHIEGLGEIVLNIGPAD